MRKIFTSLLVVLVPLGAFAQSTLWQDVKEDSIPVRSERLVVPASYRTVRLDSAALGDLLAQAPMEFTAEAKEVQTVITIPMPDGGLAGFRIQESPISLPDPSGKISDFRSYSGQGIDDPTATLRFDISPDGFHAQILSSGESVYVDPYAKGDTTNCISYWRHNSRRDGARHIQGASPRNPRACRQETLRTLRY